MEGQALKDIQLPRLRISVVEKRVRNHLKLDNKDRRK